MAFNALEDVLPVWGHRPLPLLPAGLRAVWAREVLPDWVASELGLPPDATFASLGAEAWRTIAGDEIPRYVRQFLLDRLEYRSLTLRDVAILGREWPDHLNPREIAWSVRTWNCLSNAGLIDRPDLLSRVTPATLRRLKNMGPVSILDFACTVEALLSREEAGRAGRTDVSGAWLNADREWWDQIDAADPRFRGLVPADAGTLGNHARVLRSERRRAAAATREFRVLERQARARLERLRAMSLDEAIADLAATAAGLTPGEVGFLLRRLGLTGEPPLTRKAVQALTGVGARRLHKYETAFFEHLPNGRVLLPQLDDAMRLLETLAPCSLTAASAALRARGLTRASNAVPLVLRAARLFRRNAAVKIDEPRETVVPIAVASVWRPPAV